MKIRMFSYGGSGFKFLSKLLHNKYISARFPAEIHPYISHNKPRDEFAKFDKIIFIYGDPRNAILSHVRRAGYRKIQDKSVRYQEFMFNTRRFVQLSRPFEIENTIPLTDMTLTNFLSAYPDYLDFIGFFKSWLDFQFPKNYILFLKYERLPNHIDKLAKFLGLGSKFKRELKSTFKSRRTNYLERPKAIVKLLNNNYKELVRMHDNMPSFFVKK